MVKNIKIIFGIISVFSILFIILFFYNDKKYCGCSKESFEDLNQVQTIPTTGIPNGFYQIDEKNMSALPYNDYTSPLPSPPYNIPTGFYIVLPTVSGANNKTVSTIAKVPHGYAVDSSYNLYLISQTAIANYSADNNNSIDITNTHMLDSNIYNSSFSPSNIDKYSLGKSETNYTPNININKSYHNDYIINGVNSNIPFSKYKVYDKNNKEIWIDYSPVQGNITYYKPGSFLYGSNTYVPNYEDSIILSASKNIINNNYGNTISGNIISGNIISGNIISGNIISGNIISGNTIYGNTISGNTISGNIISGNTQKRRGQQSMATYYNSL